MGNVTESLSLLTKSLPHKVELVAVSKFHPSNLIQEAYDAGQRVFGESRMQELNDKQNILPKDIQWHFIGHLQTNKVKAIIPYIYMIQSVDSLKLLQEIEKQAKAHNKTIRCLLEIHIAEEDTKNGLSFEECIELVNSNEFKEMESVSICGVMGMATYTSDTDQIRSEFKKLKNFFDKLKTDYFKDKTTFSEISMGMSGDYHIAIEEGSTMIRVGSLIFGNRDN